MKLSMIMGCVLAALWLVAGPCVAQEEMRMVDNSVFASTTRTAASFNHDQHNEDNGLEDCVQCHHLYEDGQLVEDESSEDLRCADCHDGDPDGAALSLRKAYHQNCKGCHMKQKAGPILCGECHRRRPSL